MLRTQFSPLNIANLAGWWDASVSTSLYDATSGGSLVAADGAVARWEDLSGNGNHATQSVSNSRPLRRVSKLNGRDMVDFDGSNDFYSLTTSVTATTYTLFVVAKKATGTDTFIAFGCSQTLPYALIDIGGNTYASKYSSGTCPYAYSATQLLNRTSAFQATQDSSTPAIWIDGAAQTLGATGSAGGDTVFTLIGSRQGGAKLYAKAVFGEVIFYTRQLGSDERTTVERYLKSKWWTP